MVSEHHAADDGYLPSPLLVASAFAAVTSRVPITVSALLVNLYEPLRLAEDIAVLDHLSKGRVSYTFGLGYRPEEYALYSREWATRGRDIEDRISQVLAAWTDGHDHAGAVLPAAPVPLLRRRLAGGRAARSPAGAELPAPARRSACSRTLYDETCRAAGREPGFVLQAPADGPANVFCAARSRGVLGALRPPPAGRCRCLPGVARRGRLLRRRPLDQRGGDAGGRGVRRAHRRRPGRRCRSGAVRLVTSHPACGGLPPEPSWASLRLICETVLPAVRP